MIKHRKTIGWIAALLLFPLASGAASVMPYGTYLVKGAFKGDYNTVLRDFGTGTVRVQRSDGTVIAESPIADADAEGFNFTLRIPVASRSTEKTCEVGETLDCVFLTSEGTLHLPGSLKVDTPIHVGIFSINYTPVTSYTNSADGAVVEIPTAYVEEAQWWLDNDESQQGGDYDPWADYDNDGVSNYGEFLAGTNPFDASDRLRITAFRPEEGQYALAFEHVGGHVYAVSSTDALARPEWATRRVSKSAGGAELDQVLADGAEGEPGETVVFITPLAGATSEFFRVEPK